MAAKKRVSKTRAKPQVKKVKAKTVKKKVASSKPKKVQRSTRKYPTGLAVLVFILNLFIPGLGSLMIRKTRVGFGQLALFIIGILLLGQVIGIALWACGWIWALVTSIQVLKKAV